MKKELVILTTHFGTNFSGGSTATCEIFKPMEMEFDKIHVVGNQLGDHLFNDLNFIEYKNWFHLRSILKKFSDDSTIFYGDFYNSLIFTTLNKPFFFTYHDNWPELGRFGIKNKFLSILYTSAYIFIFKKAAKVFTVSNFKLNFVKKYTSNFSLIRNGFRNHTQSNAKPVVSKKILMVGNIDSRKYKLAIPLLKKLLIYSNVEVEVYLSLIHI